MHYLVINAFSPGVHFVPSFNSQSFCGGVDKKAGHTGFLLATLRTQEQRAKEQPALWER